MSYLRGLKQLREMLEAEMNADEASRNAEDEDIWAALFLKATASDVTAALALKADAAATTSALAGKASTSDLTTGLAGKADVSHTHAGLAILARSTASDTSSSTTLKNLTGLTFSGEANTTYDIFVGVPFQNTSLLGGLGLAITGPSGADLVAMTEIPSSLGGLAALQLNVLGTAVVSTSIGAINTNQYAVIHGRIRINATAGPVQVQFSRGGTGTITVQANCILRAFKIA